MGFAGWLTPLHADPGNQPPPLTWLAVVDGVEVRSAVRRFLPPSVSFSTCGGSGGCAPAVTAWPALRTWSWCLGGIGTASIAGMSALGAYDTVLFSVHMVQHMMLTMITPVFLAIGAPVTLLLRNLDGAGKRRVMAMLHSWPLRVLFFPPLATALLIATPFALYLTVDLPLHPRRGLGARPAARLHGHGRVPVLLPDPRQRPDARPVALPVAAAAVVHHDAGPRVPRHDDHGVVPADRRGLVPGVRPSAGRRARSTTSTTPGRSCGPPAT